MIKSKPELYKVWQNMKQRCYNKDSINFEYYGGRGISICDRWMGNGSGFFNFVADMGIRPKDYSIERIDNNGNYEPSNCKWASKTDQCLNRRTLKSNRLGVTGVCETNKYKNSKNKYRVQLNYKHEIFMPSNNFTCPEIAQEVYEHLKSLLPNTAMIRYKCSLTHNRAKTSTNVRGVTKRSNGRFEVQKRINGVKTYLGCFDKLDEAAQCYKNN